MEARNGLTHLGPIMLLGGAGKYNKGRINILKLSCNNTEVVSIKKTSNYATCSSNNWVKLRWQPKFPMALNGLIWLDGG